MGKNGRTLKNIISVSLSNCTTILSGIVVGFLIPKILSIYGYGMYKTFTLYTTYIGFFSLGIIDGIVLDYGGYNYEQLNQEKFRSFFKWYLAVHLLGFFALIVASVFVADSEIKFIILSLGLDMIAVNITGYYQQISQFTQRFREYSIRKILQSLSNVLVVLCLFAIYRHGNTVGYHVYVVSIVFVNCALTLWYVFTYRQITFGKSLAMQETKAELVHLIKIGFPLLFANLCATLILTLDRQFVNVFFDTTTYAVYAFAYNMLSLVTVATSAIALVLYPTLKRTTRESMTEKYPQLVGIILLSVFAANMLYFPLSWFVQWFLPKYESSLHIFRIIFPGLSISSAITVVMHNYYKVLGENLLYFFKSIIVLIISAVANWIAYIFFHTTESISIASVITMIIWYLIIEEYFVKNIQYSRWKNFLYLLVMMVTFYIVTTFTTWWIGLIVYILLFMVITILFYHEILTIVIKAVLKKI